MTVLLRLSAASLLVLSVFLSPIAARPQFSNPEPVYKREALNAEEFSTNAARMAAGLGPLMPRQLFNPSRVNVARAGPSSLPGTCGRILVTNEATGAVLGFVDKNYDPDGRFKTKTIIQATGDHLTVCFNSPSSVTITSNGNPKHPLLGFAHGSTTLQPSNDFAVLTGTNPTTPGAQQVGNGMQLRSNTNLFSESPIWSFNALTGKLSSAWFNPGSPPASVPVNIYFNPADTSLVESRSPPNGYVAVDFTIVP